MIIQSDPVDNEEDLSWSQHYWNINPGVSYRTVEVLRTVMLATEEAVSKRCGMDFSGIKESVTTYDRKPK